MPEARPPSRSPAQRSDWSSGLLGGGALVLLSLVLFVPGIASIPVVDRDEARFAQASRQMLASEDIAGWVVPRVQDRPRLNKPPLVYWLQSASAAAAGERSATAIWPYRVPSVLAALLAVLVTWRIGRSMFGGATGWLGAALLAASPMLVWDAHQARSDQLLLAVTTITLGLLWRCVQEHRAAGRVSWRRALPFWLALGLGILSKGPVTPLVAGSAAIAYALAAGRPGFLLAIRPATGVIVALAPVLPWVALVAHAIGLERYLAILQDEVVGRSLEAKESHGGPPGYHLVLLPALLWPGSLVTAAAVVRAVRRGLRLPRRGGPLARWRRRAAGRPAELFCLCWILPAWIVFELVQTKLPHYTLPLYPPLALLGARALLGGAGRLDLGTRIGDVVWLLIGLGFVVAAALAALLGVRADWVELDTTGAIAFGGLLLAGLATLVPGFAALWRGRRVRGQMLGLATSCLVLPAVTGLLLPAVRHFWMSDRLAAALGEIDPDAARPIADVGWREDSMIFVTRGRAERVGLRRLGPWLAEHPEALLLVRDDQLEGATLVRAEPPIDVDILATVDGFNYSRGETVSVHIARSRE